MDSPNKTINQKITQFILRIKMDSQFRVGVIVVVIALLSSLYFWWQVISDNTKEKASTISWEKQLLKTEELAITYDENKVSEKDFSDILFTLEWTGINKELIQLAREKNDLNISLSGSTLLLEAIDKQNTDLIQLLVERWKVDTKEEYYAVEKQLNWTRDNGQKILLWRILQMLFYQKYITDDEVLKLRSIINSIWDIAGKRALINRLDTTRDFNFIVESSYYETKYPLEIAFAENNEPLIELLLNNWAEINDSVVWNIINRTLTVENEKTFSKYFLDYFKKSESLKDSILSFISKDFSKDIFDYLVQNWAKLDFSQDKTSKFFGSDDGGGINSDMLDYLATKWADFNSKDYQDYLISTIKKNNINLANNLIMHWVKMPDIESDKLFTLEEAKNITDSTAIFLIKYWKGSCEFLRTGMKEGTIAGPLTPKFSKKFCSLDAMKRLQDLSEKFPIRTCLQWVMKDSFSNTTSSENLYNTPCEDLWMTAWEFWKENWIIFQ